MRNFTTKRYKTENRRSRRRKEIFVRLSRKTSKIWTVIVSEFRIWMIIAASGVLTIILGILLGVTLMTTPPTNFLAV